MDKPNVNNLNGIPNFGHGFPEEVEVPVKPEIQEEATPIEEVEISNQE